MKHTKLFLFSFALFITCYVAYYSVQRNTLAPTHPLCDLTVATTETDDFQKGFTVDVINDLAHRMTQKPEVKICSAEMAIDKVKRGQAHCAIVPKQLAEQEKSLLVASLRSDPSHKVFVVSSSNPDLFKRTHATLLEMAEDGALNDFAHKWSLA